MSEFEFVEMFYLNGDDVFDGFVAYSTAVFGYFVAGHMAAADLSRSSVLGLTALYTVFLILPISAILGAYFQLEKIVTGYFLAFPNGWAIPYSANPFAGVYPLLAIFALFWVASIYYVHFVVRKNV